MPSKQRHPSSRGYPAARSITWQQWVVCAYVLIFGAILPFICWGAWAQPGHPHSRPHFVFLMPELAGDAMTSDAGALEVTHRDHDAAAHAGHATGRTPPPGQALPDLVLLMMALGLVLSLTGYTFRPQVERRLLFLCLLLTQLRPGVPTPPPRPA